MSQMEQITRDSHLALCEAQGVRVTFSRDDKTVPFVAVPGSTPFILQAQDGAASVDFVSRDWLFLSELLVLDDERTKPQRGDKITEEKPDGAVFVYEVLPDNGVPPWRWSDKYGVVLRTHTKQIQKEGEGA